MIADLIRQDAAANQKALRSGNPFDFFMMSAPQAALDMLVKRMQRESDSAMTYICALLASPFAASGAAALASHGKRLLFKFGSVNILVLGVGGEQLKFAGAGRWEKHAYTLYDADHERYG